MVHLLALPDVADCRYCEGDGKEDRGSLVGSIDEEASWHWMSQMLASRNS